MSITRMPAAKAPRKDKTACLVFEAYENNKKRWLKLDANALADFEQETGMGFAQMVNQKALFGATRALFWAGLKRDDRILTLEAVGDLMTKYLRDEGVEPGEHGINQLMMVVLDAAVEQGALGRMKKLDEEEDPEDSAPETKKEVAAGESENPNVIDATVMPTN